MSSLSQDHNERILSLVGSIVLVSQDAEMCLKIVLPFLGSEDRNLSDILRRHESMKRRTLGELAGKLVDANSSEPLDFARHMAYLVAARNKVVHHFNETYGAQLSAGSYQEVFDALGTLLANLKIFRSMLQEFALVVFEGLRDVTFRDTPQYESIAQLCASLRARVAS